MALRVPMRVEAERVGVDPPSLDLVPPNPAASAIGIVWFVLWFVGGGGALYWLFGKHAEISVQLLPLVFLAWFSSLFIGRFFLARLFRGIALGNALIGFPKAEDRLIFTDPRDEPYCWKNITRELDVVRYGSEIRCNMRLHDFDNHSQRRTQSIIIFHHQSIAEVESMPDCLFLFIQKDAFRDSWTFMNMIFESMASIESKFDADSRQYVEFLRYLGGFVESKQAALGTKYFSERNVVEEPSYPIDFFSAEKGENEWTH